MELQSFQLEPLDTEPSFFDDVCENAVQFIQGTEKTQTVYWQNSFVTVSEFDQNGGERKTRINDTKSSGKGKLKPNISLYITSGKVKIVDA